MTTDHQSREVLKTQPPQSDGDLAATTPDSDYSSVEKRETWARKIDFLLACIGFSVGLGNVWRFPYLCYKNGGGAFLIPYLLFVIIGGIPMFYLEVSVGQFLSQGGVGTWNIVPILQGIGVATMIIVFLLNCYYNIILTWAFRYLFGSMAKEVPWSDCNNPWNTEQCRASVFEARQTALANYTNTTGDTEAVNYTAPVFNDPVTEYWERHILKISDGIEHPGTINWDLALCLLLAWIVVYFCIWKGIKTSGKVMYFTATSPYVLMLILLIRGVTLDGAIDGIEFYLKPNMTRLWDVQTWVDAGTQIFFSYSISLGTLNALGSYNKFHHDSYKDSMIFAACNSGTSFFAGFVIFSTLGFMAKQQGVSVGKVAAAGPGLAFIAYPQALSKMPVAPFWSVLFFFMIILLGLDSQFVGVEGFVTAVVDAYPRYLRKRNRKEIFIAFSCVIAFFVGLPMVTEGGMYVFQLFDYYSGSRIILLVAFIECVAISYVYGINRYWLDIENMIGYRPIPYMKYCWCILTPIFNIVVFILSAVTYSDLDYKRKNSTYFFPSWAVGIGWAMAWSSFIWIPIVAVYKILNEEGSLSERVRKLCQPILPQRYESGEMKEEVDLALSNPNVDYKDPDGIMMNKV